MAVLYRKSSIEKLSNPEQLDRVITISSPMSWMALVGVLLIIVATVVWSVVGTLPTTIAVSGVIVPPQGVCAAYAGCAGLIISVDKHPGDSIVPGDQIASIMTGDGSKIVVEASEAGTVSDALVEVGQQVYAGAELLRYTPSTSEAQLVACYIPTSAAGRLAEGMEVMIYPVSVDSQQYGHMEGWVESVGAYPANTNNLWYVLGADNLMADQFLSNGPVMAVICRLRTDPDTKSGYYWSSKSGGELTMANGTGVSAVIVTDRCAPITKLIRGLKEQLEN